MAKDAPSTAAHRGPAPPRDARGRAALVCAFPRPLAVALPDSGTVIGRAWLADRKLADPEVSSAHLRIDRAGGALRVADAGSRNGTWVNGARLAPRDLTPLVDGALVRLGRTLFVYREALEGPFDPMAPVGELVGPFGLRGAARVIASLGPRERGGHVNHVNAHVNALIEGETGVGKELVARAVAAAVGGTRAFVAVNIAGLARGVFESQMFGHVAGAFSDARSAAPGVLVAHDGGVVFLDEIGELDLDLQVKLLRVLENREVLPVGASRPVRVDVTLLAATNRDLDQRVEEGSFRRDLLARLAAARIRIPPLRHRVEDIFAVACELARRAQAPLLVDGSPREGVEVEAVERLLLEPWPSNVRGLDAVLTATRRVDPEPGLRLWAIEKALGSSVTRGVTGGAKAALTEASIEAALAEADGNVSAAAARLGVSRGMLLRHRKRAAKA